MTTLARRLKYAGWVLYGRLGRRETIEAPQRATVLITYYNPERMRHLNPQIRNVLKCAFVEKLVISNHNPDVRIEERVKVDDPRIVCINQETRRGCGYRWAVADALDPEPEYLIVVDDDILLFPWQLAALFKQLLSEPRVPHGFAGMLHRPPDHYEYREKEERPVDYLCEIYAVTRSHLKRYAELKALAAGDPAVAGLIENAMDFMVISQAGRGRPRIHDAGRLFRSETYDQAGVAVHKRPDFDAGLPQVSRALQDALDRGARPSTGAPTG
jgi:hypothetical protein